MSRLLFKQIIGLEIVWFVCNYLENFYLICHTVVTWIRRRRQRVNFPAHRMRMGYSYSYTQRQKNALAGLFDR